MEKIKLALLTGQRRVNVMGVEIYLPTLPRDTQKAKEKLAEKEAQKLYKLIVN